MTLVAIALQAILGTAFLALGLAKIAGLRPMREAFQRLRLPQALRYMIGPVEALGGTGMLASILQPFLAFFVASLLGIILIGALAVHAQRAEPKGWPVPALLLVATLGVIALQPLGLRVLALPHADDLPQVPVASGEVLQTLDPGVLLESLAVLPDGAILMAANRGLDLQTGDMTGVKAQLIRRGPDGRDEVFFALPPGATAGVIAVGPGGTVYMTSDGAVPALWQITPTGAGEVFAKLPPGAWPNGLTIGPDGQLYVADSRMGKIWRIDPATAAVSAAIDSLLLRPRPWIALAPGANGLDFHGSDLIVTVSDRATVLRFRQEPDGSFAAPEVVATGVPGDDLAIDTNGVLYVTTHPYDTIVRITPDGERSVIATAEHGIAGATDAAFGALPGGERVLYVTTDGGAFAGNPDAAGSLVALRIDAS